jgi:hypothetical protein
VIDPRGHFTMNDIKSPETKPLSGPVIGPPAPLDALV